ncbi:MAG: NAD+ synthase [Thermincolia bacterium]
MKVTIAQVNPIVGDIEGNLAKIKDLLGRCEQESSDLVVFPELFLVGYPPKDILERSWFIDKVGEAVEELVKFSTTFPSTGILIGVPRAVGQNHGKGLYNSAVLIYQGKILSEHHKSLLPTYDVFDEARYFEPSLEIRTVSFKGETLGISLCEDAWNDPELWPGCRMYSFDPIGELARQGATLLVNISASPFNLGKEEIRFRIISNHARKHKIPFIYVNQVGANDELIFDGRSMFVDKNGDAVTLCPSFREHIETVDAEESSIFGLYQPQERMEALCEALVLGIKDYLAKTGFNKAVVGLSGGIDSAITYYLAVKALGRENVLGISMPSPFSSEGSVEDSRKLAENLGAEFKVISIADTYHSYLDTLRDHFADRENDITEENIQARIRGNILMAFSNKYGHLVLATGNKSELAVGYCTLYGDMSGGLSVLADVPKTMVYELAEYINRDREIIPKETIEKLPSAELRPDQLDQDTLPPYSVLDEILYYYIEEGYSVDEIIARGFEAETVKWVVKAIHNSEYKRKQAALGLKVSGKAFGVGRRMPIAAK